MSSVLSVKRKAVDNHHQPFVGEIIKINANNTTSSEPDQDPNKQRKLWLGVLSSQNTLLPEREDKKCAIHVYIAVLVHSPFAF